MTVNMIEAHDIHKTYTTGTKKLQVLKEISLEVKRGEFISILGPSGAGKSTLLHILGGLDRPTKGKVVFEEIDLYKVGDRQRADIRNKRIGFVFQFYHLLSEFSAVENVLMPSLIGGRSMGLKHEARQRAMELLEAVGLKSRMAHKPNELSGGEQQRVAIARALVNNPDVLFCDEPTGNLDSEMGEQITQLLSGLNKERQLTVVMVTHEEKIARLAGRVLYIRDGRFQ